MNIHVPSKAGLSKQKCDEVLGWEVHREPLQLPDGTRVDSHFANIRMVDGEPHVLGVVGKGYEVIQNSEMLEMAESLRQKHRLRFSYVGIIGNGERVFFQCAAESYSVGGGDEVVPYMMFANSHDGTMSCRMTPMTERIACSNQLANIARTKENWVSIRHSGDVSTKLDEVGRLGKYFLTASAENRQLMIRLRNRAVNTRKLTEFFRTLYSQHYGVFSVNPKDESEDRAKSRAAKGFEAYKNRFDAEVSIAGASAWNMANAYTGWLQHDRGRGRNPDRSAYRRLVSSLFGVLGHRSVEAFQLAQNF